MAVSSILLTGKGRRGVGGSKERGGSDSSCCPSPSMRNSLESSWFFLLRLPDGGFQAAVQLGQGRNAAEPDRVALRQLFHGLIDHAGRRRSLARFTQSSVSGDLG